MQNPSSFEVIVERIVHKDPRYHPDAYDFIREALNYTQQHVVRRPGNVPRHVNGQQLLEGIRALALREFGPMAKTVFESWGVRRCEDFGEIVFNLVDHRFLRKTESDQREDFHNGYSFDDAFVEPFLPASKRGAKRNAAVKSQAGAEDA